MEIKDLKTKKLAELREIAGVLRIENAAKLKKAELLKTLIDMAEAAASNAQEPIAKKDAKASEDRKARKSIAKKAPKAAAEGASEAESSIAAKADEETAAKPKKTPGRKKKVAFVAIDEELGNKHAPKPQPEEIEAAELAEAAAKPAEEKAEPAAAAEQPEEKAEEAQKKDDNRYDTTGILDIAEAGFGFLRYDNFLSSEKDVYVSPTQIRRFNLKTGDEIFGVARKPNKDERFGALLYVHTVNGDEPGAARRRKDYSELTPIYPNERISLEKGSSALSMRLSDIVSPIGKGQRGLIVAPPKAGKTTLLKQIATAIERQNLEAELIVLLIDERPEEVTDMQRSIRGRVIYSTFDEQPSHHVKVAEMVLARAQRLVEHGKDVIILMDSITRLARAYNLVEPPSGRTLSGGLDPAALYKPKKFFGAARNIEEGGSITILATALVETGSRMDDMIFEEFKGTGNMELHLDRKLQEKRIFPAINLNKSGTRREDLLISTEELEAIWMMRRAVSDWGVAEATEKIVMDLCHTKTNAEFCQLFKKTRI